MPTQKKRPMKKQKKQTSKRIYQVGCAKRREARSVKQRDTRSVKREQKGGSASAFGPTTFLSRTMYPYDNTGGAPNPTDARQMGGSGKKRRYSRKYYKQSGGATYFDKLMPNHADQPINEKYTESNLFRV